MAQTSPWPTARFSHPRGILIVTAAAFAALALAIALLGAVPLDAATREALLALATPSVVGIMQVANWGGDRLFLFPATLLLFVLFPRARHRWWVWLVLMIAAPLAEGALKLLIARPRPEGLGYGFPSGHATAAAAYFGAVVYLAGGLAARLRLAVRSLALVLIVLVAAARVVLRAHWPSDVIGGVALGLTLASAAALLAAAQRRPPAG
jgi:undecaprenyl-diphosphatase